MSGHKLTKMKSTGRPNHEHWNGFTRVYTSTGRTAARCHSCKNLVQNTGRQRLLQHKAYCELTQGMGYKRRGTAAMREQELPLWVENPGTVEWTGFRQSSEPNFNGTYYAQCKSCTEVIDAVIDDMKAHRESCPAINDQSKDHENVFFDEGSGVEEEEMENQEGEVVHEEEVEEAKVVNPKTSMVIKMDGPTRERKRSTVATQLKRQAVISLANPSTSSSSSNPHCNCKKPVSRFADMARVWERKLEELPIEMALGIEKKMSDMLYEAMVVHLQTQKALRK